MQQHLHQFGYHSGKCCMLWNCLNTNKSPNVDPKKKSSSSADQAILVLLKKQLQKRRILYNGKWKFKKESNTRNYMQKWGNFVPIYNQILLLFVQYNKFNAYPYWVQIYALSNMGHIQYNKFISWDFQCNKFNAYTYKELSYALSNTGHIYFR